MSELYASMTDLGRGYVDRLQTVLSDANWPAIERLGNELLDCWKERRKVFICGNGGSAGNAVHLANDFVYGISKSFGSGLNIQALPANGSVITCLANDEGYEHVFSYPLAIHAEAGDVLIVLSGSGNSPNILEALKAAKKLGLTSYAILGFSGGKAKEMADVPIHFEIDDMQVSEDLQMVVGHMVMQWMYQNRESVFAIRPPLSRD